MVNFNYMICKNKKYFYNFNNNNKNQYKRLNLIIIL